MYRTSYLDSRCRVHLKSFESLASPCRRPMDRQTIHFEVTILIEHAAGVDPVSISHVPDYQGLRATSFESASYPRRCVFGSNTVPLK